MKHSIALFSLCGFAFTSLFGTLLHFLYDWLGAPTWIAPFSGVNESTWEHMKLLFWPMLLFAIFQGFFFRSRADFSCAALVGILTGLSLIPILFYTYNGMIGPSPDWINIAIFFLAALGGYLAQALLLRREQAPSCLPWLAPVLLSLLCLAFVLFTFYPPRLEIFRDPLTGTFGIE